MQLRPIFFHDSTKLASIEAGHPTCQHNKPLKVSANIREDKMAKKKAYKQMHAHIYKTN